MPAKPSITDQSGVLQSSSTIGNQWFVNDTLITGATDWQYTPTKSGKYSIQVTDQNNCSSPMSDQYVFTGVNDITINNQIRIYPNPAGDFINIESTNVGFQSVSVRLIDILGRKVYEADGLNLNGTTQIPTTALRDGVYILNILAGNNIFTSRLIIQH